MAKKIATGIHVGCVEVIRRRESERNEALVRLGHEEEARKFDQAAVAGLKIRANLASTLEVENSLLKKEIEEKRADAQSWIDHACPEYKETIPWMAFLCVGMAAMIAGFAMGANRFYRSNVPKETIRYVYRQDTRIMDSLIDCQEEWLNQKLEIRKLKGKLNEIISR